MKPERAESTMNSPKFRIDETYDFEFRARWRPGRIFILNSAWQGNVDRQTNLYNGKVLRKKMKEELDLDILKILGRYAESLQDIECMVSFPPEGMDAELIRRFFYQYGRRYRQNCIMITDEKDIVWTYPTRPASTYGCIGRMVRGEKFVYQNFVHLVERFMRLTYVFDKVKILTEQELSA